MSTSNPRSMGRDHVVDTGALISWPIDRLIGSIASPNQQQELIKISPDRVEIINAIEILWRNPSQEASNKIIFVPNLGDHRIAMSAFVLAALTGAKTKIKNFETVFSSSPSFLKIMKLLGVKFGTQK